jgi:hypothetical protein
MLMNRKKGVTLAAALSSLCLWFATGDALAGCRVTLKGAYTTPVAGAEKLLVYLNGAAPPNNGDKTSQVRVKVGTWYKIKGCTWSTREYRPGESFTVACTLDLGCGSKRRYRLYVRAVGTNDVVVNDGYKYLPSEDDWTESTTVDFGDLGKIVQ